jgi:hypothetical protein
MSNRFIWVLVAGVIVCASPARADFQTGNELLFFCTLNNDVLAKGICLGYVEAIADFVRYFGYQGVKYCADPNVTAQQMMDITVQFLRANPATRHLSASGIVAVALTQNFPCQ